MKPLTGTGSQSFGDKKTRDRHVPAVETRDDEFGGFDSELSLSDIEKKLLQSYPGESKHLDDSQDHVSGDIFYYTEWDDPIYDQFQDYDYEAVSDEDNDEATVEVFEPVKEVSRERTKVVSNGEIRIDLDRYPQRLPRTRSGGARPGQSATRCDKRHCQLPDCHCGGPDLPGNLTSRDTPQLVILTFDDSLNDLNRKLYESIFHPIRRNPNGCPISATFYVSHEWTDYSHVQNVYSDGHEIASHSIR